MTRHPQSPHTENPQDPFEPEKPAAKALGAQGINREQIDAVTRIVLQVVKDLQEPDPKPATGFSALADQVQNRLPLLALAVSLGLVLIAWLVYDVSLFQPLEEKAHKQTEYRLKQDQQQFRQTMLKRQLSLGKSLLDIGEYEAAKAEYEDALKLFPSSTGAQLGRYKARIFTLVSGQYSPEVIQRRIQLIRDIVKQEAKAGPGRQEDDAHARSALGDLYAPMDPETAMDHYRAAIELDPQVATAHFGRSLLLYDADDLEGAVASLEKAAAISTLNPGYLNNLGYFYTRAKAYGKAMAAYEKARQLDPSHLITYCEQAQVYLLSGDTDQALLTMEDLNWQIKNDTLMKQAKNSQAWLFPVDGELIPLSETAEKKRYILFTLAAARFLSGDGDGAKNAVTEALKIKVVFPQTIDAVIDSDLRRLETDHKILDPDIKETLLQRVSRFRKDLLKIEKS